MSLDLSIPGLAKPSPKALALDHGPRRRRGSILVWLVAGFVLVTLPLIAAVGGAFINATGLSRAGEQVVTESAAIVHLSESLAEQALALERNARQYAVLGDADLLRLALERQTQLEQTVLKMKQLMGTPPGTAASYDLQADSQSIAALLRTLDLANVGSTLDGPMARLDLGVAAWRAATRTYIDSQVAKLEVATQRTRRLLAWLMLVTIPLALLMTAVFTGLIARPLRRLGSAIRGLGQADFDTRIHVAGPADVEDLGRELDRLRCRLRESDEEKQRFLRHMSHELKTPLTSLLEGADLMADGAVGTLSEPQTEVLGILGRNARELRHLIENLLDYSAWQQNHAGLELTEFDFQILLQQVFDRHRLGLLGKNISVEQHVTPVRLRADRNKIATAVSNLISNAIKYAPVNGTVHASVQADDDAIVFELSDDGQNIAPRERSRIFEPFYTGDPPANSHLRGSGVGLSLVKEYIEAHDGSIELVDGRLPGACFRVTLPLRRDISD